MKVIEFGHVKTGVTPENLPIDTETSHLRIAGAGVVITLIQRHGEGIDITVNPSGEPYMHLVKVGEVAVSSAQVRIHGTKGGPL